MRAWALFLLATLVTPSAAATSAPIVSVYTGHGDLPVLRGFLTIPFWANVSCLPAPPAPSKIAIDVAAPLWTNTRVVPTSFDVGALTCTQGFVVNEGRIEINATPDAPARVPAPLTVRATLTDAQGEASDNATTTVRARLFGLADVRVEPQLVRLRNDGTATVRIDVANQGNGDVLVSLRLSGPMGLQVADPVGAEVARNATGTWDVTMRAEAPLPDGANVTVLVGLRDPAGGAPLETQDPTIFTVAPWGRAGVPGPALGALVAALALAVGVRRRR